MYILIVLYFLIFGLLNLYEIITNYTRWKEIIIKYKKQLPLTLLYALVLNPISLLLTEHYGLKGLVFSRSLLEEIMIFIISVNIFDIYTYITHWFQHKYYYKYHKVHHNVHETCMIFSFYNSIIDHLIVSILSYILPNIMGFSKMSLYIYISFMLAEGMLAHRIYDKDANKFTFHNYHHYNSSKNFSSGMFGTFAIMDRLAGTYKSIDV